MAENRMIGYFEIMLIQGYSSSADTNRGLDTRGCRRAYENDEGLDVEGAGRADGESVGAKSSEGGRGTAWGRGLGEAGYEGTMTVDTAMPQWRQA